MRILLDEMCSPAIARELRRRGHDVVASLERDELRGLADDALLALAGTERCAVATFDVGDFARLATGFRAEERDHHGVILISPRRFSAGSDGVGAVVRALDAALEARPGDDELMNATLWLGSG